MRGEIYLRELPEATWQRKHPRDASACAHPASPGLARRSARQARNFLDKLRHFLLPILLDESEQNTIRFAFANQPEMKLSGSGRAAQAALA